MTTAIVLNSPEGRQVVSQVASAFGVDEQNASAAVQSLGGDLKARIERNMLSRGGVADVLSLITQPAAGIGTANLASPEAVADGNHVLDVLIGNKHVSRGIAARAASRSGIDAATVEKMLPVVAGLLISQLQQKSKPALQKLVSDVPALSGAGGSPLPMPGDRLPRANPQQDAPADYTPGTGSSPGTRRGPIDAGGPLPLPGDHLPGSRRRSAPAPEPEQDEPEEPGSPYDRLPDIVRRGGGPSVPGGGSLEDVIRSILGNLLGSNRGVIGTMIQLFLIRWLTSFLRSILTRIFGGGR